LVIVRTEVGSGCTPYFRIVCARISPAVGATIARGATIEDVEFESIGSAPVEYVVLATTVAPVKQRAVAPRATRREFFPITVVQVVP